MMKKVFAWFLVLGLVGVLVASAYGYYADEVNDTRETAIFVKSGDTITGQFETDGDVEVFKLVVIEVPGTLRIDFKPQKKAKISPGSIRISIYNSRFEIVKSFQDIGNIPHDREPDFVTLRYNFLERGVYYLRIEAPYVASVWDPGSHYELRITAENGLGLASESCNPLNLSGCVEETACEDAGGYWYLGRCHQEPCTRDLFHLCPDRESCSRVGGFWNDRLRACFHTEVDHLYDEGYEEGRRYCMEHPGECGIEVCEIEPGDSHRGGHEEDHSSEEEHPESEEYPDGSSMYLHCVAFYDLFSNTVHIPCFRGADGLYRVDLELISMEPYIDLRVKDVSRVEGSRQ